MLDALTGRISIRQLRVMVEHLPPEGPVARELVGPWGDDQYLLRDIANTLRVLDTSYFNTHSKTKRQAKLLPLPGDDHDGDSRSAAQVEAEQTHLLDVLNRAR